ncbi:hypothetical protein AB5N19_02951 [Seiridium cardinale]
MSSESLGHPNPLALHPVNQQRYSTRRISAGFPTDGPPSSLPSVATSSLTVSTTHGELSTMYTTAPRPTRKVTPTSIPLPEASIATTYETAVASYPQNDENVPPGSSRSSLWHKHKNSIDIAAAKLQARSKPRAHGILPKSNTLNVISNLTASISRNSLTKFNRSASISSTTESEPRTSLASVSSVALPTADIGNPRQIHTAQASAYWTGRFMALQDRFRNEMLMPENMTTLITAHAERSIVPEYEAQAPAHLTASATQPNLGRIRAKGKSHRYSISNAPKGRVQRPGASLDAARLEDDENRARRAFLHLEALCTTSEARKSLHAWQQTYARQMGKEELLPRGGTMEDKGLLGRLLRRGSHDVGKRASIIGIAFG